MTTGAPGPPPLMRPIPARSRALEIGVLHLAFDLMSRDISWIRITLGARSWPARLRRDLAPLSCTLLEDLLPYRGQVLHARWSGEAVWAPLAPVWPPGRVLAPENATARPRPGDILLYGAERGEPELLFAYGVCRFANNAGRLAGNPVLSLEDPNGELALAGEAILREGASELRIEPLPSSQTPRDGAWPN
ncbi:MAG: hypothetical protein JWP35_4406 [Caulobacter sp.]|nr:hypothetical protein [Caulobacter sp.]